MRHQLHLLYLLQHHDLPDQNLNAKVMNHATAIQIITFNLRIKGFLAYTIFFVELSSSGITATLFPALHGISAVSNTSSPEAIALDLPILQLTEFLLKLHNPLYKTPS